MDTALVLGLAVGVLGIAVNLHAKPHGLLANICYAVALGLFCSFIPGLEPLTAFRVAGVPIALPLVFTAATFLWARVRRAPVHPAVFPEEWRQQEARFKAMHKGIEGIWSRKLGSKRTSWQVHRTRGGAKKRDLQAFEAEARCADELLRRAIGMDRKQFRVAFGPDPVGRWLNAGVELGIDPDSDITLAGRSDGVDNEGGVANDLAQMSAVACKVLASGTLPYAVPPAPPTKAPPRSTG